MRTIFAFLMTSLDGYFEGPAGEFDWPVADEEFLKFSADQLDEADTLLFGRVTYEGMAQYWPTELSETADPAVRAKMNDTPKFVTSNTLTRPTWQNTQVLSGDTAEQVHELKRRQGRSIAVLGSSALTASLLEAGLLDELRIMVSPIVLGDGRSVLCTASGRSALSLLDARAFASGNVLLRYRPATAQAPSGQLG